MIRFLLGLALLPFALFGVVLAVFFAVAILRGVVGSP